MEEEGVDSINSGPTGGGKAIGLLEVRRLKMLVQAIRDRFSPEIEAIELRS